MTKLQMEILVLSNISYYTQVTYIFYYLNHEKHSQAQMANHAIKFPYAIAGLGFAIFIAPIFHKQLRS